MKYQFELDITLERCEMVQALTGIWLVEAALRENQMVDVPEFGNINLLIHQYLKGYGETILTVDRLFGRDTSRQKKAGNWARRVMRFYSERLNDWEAPAVPKKDGAQ